MKPPKKNNFLVSVEKDGKVIGLYWSEKLEDMRAINILHRRCKFDVIDMRAYRPKNNPSAVSNIINRKQFSKNGKPFANRVKCVETGIIYDSVPEASRQLSIPRISIYHAIRRNISAYGYHFILLPPPKKQ